jgi:sugar phosphate permease
MDFGIVKGGFGVLSVILGIPVAGYFVKKTDVLITIFFGIIGQSLTGLLSTLLTSGDSVVFISCVTVLQDFFQGFMNTTLIIYISSFCDEKFSIYHFTILSTVSSLSRAIATLSLVSLSNIIGWKTIFCLPVLICFPLAFLLAFLAKKTRRPA